jgi:uncharacterized alkaline shock family protein YloU
MANHGASGGGDSLVISEDVIAAIAVTAAKEAQGIAQLVPLSVGPGFRHGEHARFVKIGGGEAEMTLALSVKLALDVNLPQAAGEAQKAVKTAVETMPGRTVARVNITVAGIENSRQD